MTNNPGIDPSRRKAYATDAVNALNRCFTLATAYDDPNLPLWQGFSLFNIARTNLQQLDPDQGLEQFEQCVAIRKKWLGATGVSPAIQQGLAMEYFYAAAQYVQKDESLGLPEVRVLGDAYTEYKRQNPGMEFPLARKVEEMWETIMNPTSSIQRQPPIVPGSHSEKLHR